MLQERRRPLGDLVFKRVQVLERRTLGVAVDEERECLRGSGGRHRVLDVLDLDLGNDDRLVAELRLVHAQSTRFAKVLAKLGGRHLGSYSVVLLVDELAARSVRWDDTNGSGDGLGLGLGLRLGFHLDGLRRFDDDRLGSRGLHDDGCRHLDRCGYDGRRRRGPSGLQLLSKRGHGNSLS